MGRRKGSKNAKQKTPIDAQRDTKKSIYMVTINNPTHEELEVKETLLQCAFGDKIKYCKWALEEGEEEGTPHVHILFYLTEQQRFSAIKKVFPRARIEEEIFGSNRQSIDYIGNPDFIYSDKRKDNKAGKRKGGICTASGEWGSTAGIRMSDKAESSNIDSRLLALQERIKAGSSIMDLYEADFPLMVRYTNQLTTYHTAFNSLPASGERRVRVDIAIAEAKKERKEFVAAITERRREETALLRKIEDSQGLLCR